jgi:hypothetical protein
VWAALDEASTKLNEWLKG